MNSPAYIVVSAQSGQQLLPGSFPFAALAALEIVRRGLEDVAEVAPATPANVAPVPGWMP